MAQLEPAHLGGKSCGVGSLLELVYLFYRVNHLPGLGISSSGCINAESVPVLLEFVWVFWVCIMSGMKVGKLSAITKERSLGCTLDMLTSEEQSP